MKGWTALCSTQGIVEKCIQKFSRKILNKESTSKIWEAGITQSVIATGYRLDGRGVGVRVPVEVRFFSSSSRPDRFWSPLSLLSNGYRGFFLQGKALRREVDHSPPSNADV
jgi:hypothetical protein